MWLRKWTNVCFLRYASFYANWYGRSNKVLSTAKYITDISWCKITEFQILNHPLTRLLGTFPECVIQCPCVLIKGADELPLLWILVELGYSDHFWSLQANNAIFVTAWSWTSSILIHRAKGINYWLVIFTNRNWLLNIENKHYCNLYLGKIWYNRYNLGFEVVISVTVKGAPF